ncbi:hypothetical protein [Ferribacterium limneticum]|uniref:hypothetical protein n=1 Tax=Ferribacterium limneticum TaxID=76259 RepID=UPI001CF8FD5E|nr:hypothetical protein [Ferribacterium limneticum]UCV22308.1 hypothetical protein KI613_17585 [Ferribacterium limneticum]
MWTIGEPKPFTPAQLVLWIDGLPAESKTAVVTSVLTVVGFLIAFHSATVNWKAEAVAHLKASVASEIEQFFNEAAQLSTKANIYIHSLVEAVNLVHAEGATPDAAFKIRRAIDQASNFLATRDRLSVMSIEVHGIAGRHCSVLSSVWGTTKALEECAAAFEKIAQQMWIRVPNIEANHPDQIGQFVAQVNVAECKSFIECYEQSYGFINATSGGIRGTLLAPLIGINLSSILSLYGKQSVLVEALSKIRRGK